MREQWHWTAEDKAFDCEDGRRMFPVSFANHMTALEAQVAAAGALVTAGNTLAKIAGRVLSNTTLDDNGEETWFDERDAAVEAWAGALAKAQEAGITGTADEGGR